LLFSQVLLLLLLVVVLVLLVLVLVVLLLLLLPPNQRQGHRQFSAPPFQLLLLVSMSQRHGHVVPLLGPHSLAATPPVFSSISPVVVHPRASRCRRGAP